MANNAQEANSSRIAQLSTKTSSLALKVQGLKTKLTSQYLSNCSEPELKLYIELIDKWQAAFESCTDELEDLDLTRMSTSDYENFTSEVISLKALILCEITRVAPSTPGTPNQASTFNGRMQQSSPMVQGYANASSRFPTIQLPTFSGQYTEWLDFYTLFQSIIGQHNEMSNLEKFHHLKSCLKGVALETIRALELSSDNYDIAMQLLKKRFYNKHIIFQAHIQAIMGLKRLEAASADKLREVNDTVNSNLRALQALASREEIAESFINYIVLQKLDYETQAKWQERSALEAVSSWNSLSQFIEMRSQLLDNLGLQSRARVSTTQIAKHKSSFVSNSCTSSECAFCSDKSHAIYNCTKFLDLTPVIRLKEAKRLLLCLNCLKRGHKCNKCSLGSCKQCHEKHNTLLHLGSASRASGIAENVTEKPSCSNVISSSQVLSASSHSHNVDDMCSDTVLLATAIIYVKGKHGSLMPCRAILDSGSQSHFVTSRFADALQIPRSKSHTTISGIGESSSTTEGYEIAMSIQSQDGAYTTSLTALIVKSITGNQPHFDIHTSNWNIPSNLTLADASFHSPGRIDVLLGASLFFNLLCVGQIHLGPGLPIIQKTRLGWIISGGTNNQKGITSLITKLETTTKADSQLENIIKKFWEIDGIAEGTSLASAADLECERHFVSTHHRLPSGEYVVRFPMKLDKTYLGDSYQLALRRFLNLERKLSRDTTLKSQYVEFIREYEELQHMTIVPEAELNKCMYFLPHHCVLKADSSTTKLRVVFDGSASSSTGYSLNDLLFSGPTIQANLFNLLIRFRMFPIAITADICKMYRCVRVATPDDYLQCIIWRNHVGERIKVYKLNTVTYGTRAAAFLAIRSMQQLAHVEANAFPLGSETVLNDFYVDDLITGGNSIEHVNKIKKETTKLLRRGNFTLRKWCTNSQVISESIPKDQREPLRSFDEGANIKKALGLIWDPIVDNFIFKFDLSISTSKCTKRIVLSAIARFYDPLGLIGPVVTRAKIFMQRLWQHKLHWDESLPQALQTQWLEIYNNLSDIKNLSFPRYCLQPEAAVEVHAFCDASAEAYGVCIYMVSQIDNKKRAILLCSKSRVAPLKVLTIPKLELSAAFLLAQLLQNLGNMGAQVNNIHCWSDSTIVLSWLNAEPSRFNVFVANRVSQIQQITKGMQWHHISTELNPADILSRGASPGELIRSSLWSSGPPFLLESNSGWDDTFQQERNLPELKKNSLCAIKTIDPTAHYKYINSFSAMQKIFGYVYKFIKRKRTNSLTVEDMEKGTHLLIKIVQAVRFPCELKALSAKKMVSGSSSIYSLSPFLDQIGLLRVGGRLKHSNLSYSSRHPIILPKGHPLSSAIIRHFHVKYHHMGPQSLLATLRLTYWPVGGKMAVNSVVNNCIRCFRSKPILMQHIMGDLPSERVTPSPAFCITGIDYCGPLYHQPDIRRRSPTKCYLSIFICFTTKAIHLELVKDLSTSAFIAALRRFVSTRGRPKTIWSDNATNFVGAKNELNELIAMFNSSDHNRAVHSYCLSEGIEWRFIPPRAPHFGGLWESAVKMAKYHLLRSTANALLNFDELRTLICQISATINSRPLVPTSERPDDLDVLTPAHFLIGGPFTAILEPNIIDLNTSRLDRWQRVQQMLQVFWKRWSAEYLTLLQQRSKWRSPKDNLAVGDMVLIKDENLPPLKWPLGRVTDVIKGTDNVVRVASVKTANNVVKRAVTKLCLLPSNDIIESQVLSTGGECSKTK